MGASRATKKDDRLDRAVASERFGGKPFFEQKAGQLKRRP
jgi:hypothetical protein